jgi:hypothetical protein
VHIADSNVVATLSPRDPSLEDLYHVLDLDGVYLASQNAK